jgi:hypothetical protein
MDVDNLHDRLLKFGAGPRLIGRRNVVFGFTLAVAIARDHQAYMEVSR